MTPTPVRLGLRENLAQFSLLVGVKKLPAGHFLLLQRGKRMPQPVRWWDLDFSNRATGKVRDLDYGDVLFHFFQDKYFSAITGLMVSQHFERVQKHADEAERVAD